MTLARDGDGPGTRRVRRILRFTALLGGGGTVRRRGNLHSLALLATALALHADAVGAGDARAGRAKALMCQTCHGIDGLSKVPEAPNIAGQVENYLVAQLRAFKSGARKNEAMSVVAATLSDEDIGNLAAYFSGIEVKIGRIPGD